MAKAPWQHRHGARPGGVFLLAHKYPEFTVQHAKSLIVAVVHVDRDGVAAPGKVIGQDEGPTGLLR